MTIDVRFRFSRPTLLPCKYIMYGAGGLPNTTVWTWLGAYFSYTSNEKHWNGAFNRPGWWWSHAPWRRARAG